MVKVVPLEGDPPKVTSNIIAHGSSLSNATTVSEIRRAEQEEGGGSIKDVALPPIKGGPSRDQPPNSFTTNVGDKVHQTQVNEQSCENFDGDVSDLSKDSKAPNTILPTSAGTGGEIGAGVIDTKSQLQPSKVPVSEGDSIPTSTGTGEETGTNGTESQVQASKSSVSEGNSIPTSAGTGGEAGTDGVDTESQFQPSKASTSEGGEQLTPPTEQEVEESQAGGQTYVISASEFSKTDLNPEQVLENAQEDGHEHNSEAPSASGSSEDGEESERTSEHSGAIFARRGTRRYIPRSSQKTGSENRILLSKGKSTAFNVPQAMFKGHPVGSTAGMFLERQDLRVREVKTRREEVAHLLRLVIDHNSITSGSPLPDIDAVFPLDVSDQDEGDRYV